MTPFEFAALIGAFTGSISLGFLIFKSITNKPKLTFEHRLKNFYPAEGNNFFSVIVIRMKVHNRGTKPTTIHHSTLTFNYNSEPKKIEDETNPLEIPPNSTVDYYPNLHLHKNDLIIHGKITNCKLMVKHTHDEKMIDLGTIEENKK